MLFTASFFAQSLPINYGDALSGDLQFENQVDEYSFTAEAGDIIYLRMRDAESPVDACFQLIDPTGQFIAEECGNGGIVQLKGFEIEAYGTYTILAYDKNHNDLGSYGISLNKLNSPAYAQEIDCAFDGEFELTVTTEVKTFKLFANEGDILKSRMRGESQHFESELEIYDADGNQLAAEYGSGLSEIEINFPSTGYFTLTCNDRNGNDLGVFGLGVQLLNGVQFSNEVNCGDNLTSVVSTIAGMQAYHFSLDQTTSVIAQARSSNSSFETQMVLYNEAGDQLIETEGSSKLVNITATLDPGKYNLVVLDKGGNDTAEFGLAIQYIGANNCAEAVYCANNSSEGNFTSLAAMKAYKFSGDTGDLISSECLALSEHLDPEIMIFNHSGDLLIAEHSFQMTTIEDFPFDAPGECILIIRDLNGNDTGAFKHSITSETIFNLEPVPTMDELPTIYANCQASLEAPTAEDLCQGIIFGTTNDAIQFSQQGTHTVTWTYESENGVSTQQIQKVIIEDQEAPIITCGDVIVLELDSNGELFLPYEFFKDYVYDECTGVAWVESNLSSFDCSNVGMNEIDIWTEDLAGNPAFCALTIEIVGNGCQPACGDLPSDWSLTDIGDPTGSGSVCYDPQNPTFEVTGYGKDIFGSSDQFTFVHKQLCGDGVIQANISSMTSTNDYALAGVMMRQNTHSHQRYAALLATPDQGIIYQTRLKPNGYTLYEAHEGHPPAWVKLVRIGNMISGYISKDAEEWELSCEIEVKVGQCYEVGLAVSAYSDSESNTALFDNVEVYNIQGKTLRQASFPSALAMADPCKFEIQNRGDKSDCTEEEEPEPVITAFPNPAVDWINIDGSEFMGSAVQVMIVNKRGKIYYNAEFDVAPINLPIDIKALRLPNGCYSVIVKDSKNTASKAFLVIDEG